MGPEIHYEPGPSAEPGGNEEVASGHEDCHFGPVLGGNFASASDASGCPDDKEADEPCEYDTLFDGADEDPNDYLECYEAQVDEVHALEEKARRMRKNKEYDHEKCHEIIKEAVRIAGNSSNRSFQNTGKMIILGAYVHGGINGITAKSGVFHETTRYLNSYLRYCNIGVKRWTSLCFNVNKCHRTPSRLAQ